VDISRLDTLLASRDQQLQLQRQQLLLVQLCLLAGAIGLSVLFLLLPAFMVHWLLSGLIAYTFLGAYSLKLMLRNLAINTEELHYLQARLLQAENVISPDLRYYTHLRLWRADCQLDHPWAISALSSEGLTPEEADRLAQTDDAWTSHFTRVLPQWLSLIWILIATAAFAATIFTRV